MRSSSSWTGSEGPFHINMSQGVTDIDGTATGGGEELTRRQPPAGMQRHDVGDTQFTSRGQWADAQLLDAVTMDQIKPF